jgi:AraC family transcriptional regulator, regulatory protein of adaptative response / methylated-DNA-[protein]-cysteine methyltransferase
MTKQRKPASSARAARRPAAAGTGVDWSRVLLHTCRRIESATGPVPLAKLAAAEGVGTAELSRQFRQRLGASPKAYQQALLLHRLTRGVAAAPDTLQAMLAAGFESVSSGYQLSNRSLGVAPGRLRRALAIDWWLGLSALGWMLMAATPRGICWLAFGEQPAGLLGDLRGAFPRAQLQPNETRLREWFDDVREFILLPTAALDLPLDVQGTAFQARVWRALRRVPLGTTVSYGELARRVRAPAAVRAVGTACGANRVAVLIPCHRALRGDGSPGGYRWGLGRKARLLVAEQAPQPPAATLPGAGKIN